MSARPCVAHTHDRYFPKVNYWEASPPRKKVQRRRLRHPLELGPLEARGPCRGPCGAPRLNVALMRVLSTSSWRCWRRRARAALTDRVCARRNWHGAHATSSVDGWASMALRSNVVEAAGVRSSERRRAWADKRSKRASEPDAEPPPRARWSTHYSPRTHVPLTRRLRRAVAVWPEEPRLTPAPTLLRRRHLLLHGHRTASLDAATRGAAMRGAACAAPPAPSLRRAACA